MHVDLASRNHLLYFTQGVTASFDLSVIQIDCEDNTSNCYDGTPDNCCIFDDCDMTGATLTLEIPNE